MNANTRAGLWLMATMPAFGQYAEIEEVYASDVYLGGRFGSHIALEGDEALVGDLVGDNAHVGGIVYVLERINGAWTEVDFLQPPDLVSGDRFGAELERDGEWALVCAMAQMPPAVYVYQKTPVGWRQTQKITGPDPSPYSFGRRIALDGDRVLIGAHGQATPSGQGSGVGYLYERNGLQWNLVQRLTPSVPEFGVGFSVALDGDWAVLSAHHHHEPTSNFTGAAYVFRRIGGTFVEVALLQAPVATPQRYFGKYMAMADGTLVLSDGNSDAFFASRGRIHIYTQGGPGPSGLSYEGSFLPSDGYLGDRFATPPSGGLPIAISGDAILVGAEAAREAGVITGAAYLFKRIGGLWTETDKLQWSRAEMSDVAGQVVALDGSTAFSSGPGIDGPTNINGGGIYVYEVPLGVPYCAAAPTSTGLAAEIWAVGSSDLDRANLSLRAFGLPAHELGYFLASRQRGFTPAPPGSSGNLCLGLPIARFVQQVASSGAAGVIEIALDAAALPSTPPSPILAGETWNFQAWFRDHDPQPTSNFTDAMSVRFR